MTMNTEIITLEISQDLLAALKWGQPILLKIFGI